MNLRRLSSRSSSGYLTIDDEAATVTNKPVMSSKAPTFWPFVRRVWHFIRFRLTPHRRAVPKKQISHEDLLDAAKTSCIISTKPMSPVVALKISQDVEGLQQEYSTHKIIEDAFRWATAALNKMPGGAPLPYIPICFDFYPDFRSTEFASVLDHEKWADLNSAAYTMELIRPFHLHYVKYLVKRHLSHPVQRLALNGSECSSFLPEVCLGDLSPLPDRWQPHLQHRAAYVDQLEREGVNLQSVSEIMGFSLALMHWGCHIDGAGVRFVLGCDRRGHIHMWLTRFGECKPLNTVKQDIPAQLVDAIMNNSACWPKWINLCRYRGLWNAFRQGYIRMALLLHDDDESTPANQYLPLIFINDLQLLRGPPKKNAWKGIHLNGTA